MNGVPEAIGTGVSKLVDINPAIGILIGILIVALLAVTKWGLDGWKAARLSDKNHSDYVEALLVDANKMQDRLDRLIEATAVRGK